MTRRPRDAGFRDAASRTVLNGGVLEIDVEVAFRDNRAAANMTAPPAGIAYKLGAHCLLAGTARQREGRTNVSEDAGPAIEVRIGPGGIDDALRAAEVASGLGADRVGVSTPLIYAHGLEIIAKIRRQTRDVPILSNLTIHDGCFRFLAESRRHGAEVGTVSAIHNHAGCRQGVRARLATGIRVLADMTCMATADLLRQAREIEAIGMDGLVVSLGHDPARYDTARRESDGVAAVVEAVSIPVGCVVTSLEEAHAAGEQGADWLILEGSSFGAAAADLESAIAEIRARAYPRRRRAQPARTY